MIAAAALALSSLSAAAQTGPSVGTVAQMQGQVSVTREGVAGGGAFGLTANAPIYSEDILETGPGAKLLVTFIDGTRLTLGPNADVIIDEFVYNPNGGANNAALRVTGGAMRLVAGAVERIGGPQAVSVATPVATIGIRGTDFFVEMEDEHLAVALFSGFEVAVTNAAGETVLRPGEGTDIFGPGAPTQPLTWGVDRVNRALALVTLAENDRRPLPYAQPVAVAATPDAAFMQGKFKFDARYRYEMVDQASRSRDAFASTLRLRAGYETLGWNGFFGGIEGEITREIGNNRRSDGVSNNPALPVIADPESEVLNRLYVGWTDSAADGLAQTRAVLGRQRIMYDNERWIGPVAFRQNDQTFDALAFETRAVDHVALRYAYINRVNRILGNSPGGHWNSNSHLLGISTDYVPFGIVTAYAYLLDLNPVPLMSSATYGLRYDALYQQTDDFAWGIEAEVAQQTDHGGNPGAYMLTYALVRPMVKLMDTTTISAGWEHLGGNGFNAVQAPLATLHRHNGWADVFTTTPANGLQDLHIRVMQEMPDAGFIKNPKLDLRFHDFRAARGGAHYGSEFDADVNFSILGRVTLGARFAHYDAKTFGADTTKAWFYVEMQY